MHPLFRCRVSKLVNDPAFPEFDVAVTGYGPMPAHQVIPPACKSIIVSALDRVKNKSLKRGLCECSDFALVFFLATDDCE